ncbi:hypothetical protein AN639_08210 [Candidatus Epulonipiscium fishelsonii]|uniref:Uncharacterized protein n=1 Tax=Candidatus Epulonipiscium fishelsonii TaxID=77094 RepID=A0ACC8XC37_9FIRM|nr:hypothetical protein AN639_08210 [Epulopiscium sp. SCG-B05WGA-EpuloA1]ONI40081.1 hypothetical protein AN396_06430 [Epulopiscium sp. SCG-B11WGA-EpuloA1]
MAKKIDEIRNLLYINKKVYVNELSEHYNISLVSIRKYLRELEKEGTAIRFYGGAELKINENNLIAKNADDILQGSLILTKLAQKAVEQINDNDIIFLGSGITCGILAKLLYKFNNLSVITNNITALEDLLNAGVRIYLIGGEVSSVDGISLFSSSNNLNEIMKNIRVNKAFTSASGFDMQKGFTVKSLISTYIYQLIPDIASEWYMMMDSSKFNKLSMYTVASLDKINYIITNEIPIDYLKVCKENNIKLHLV